MPESRRHVEDLAGLEGEAGLGGLGEKGEFFEVWALDIRNGGKWRTRSMKLGMR